MFLRGTRESSGIELRILLTSLNQDGEVDFSEMKVLIPILIGLLIVGYID